jgi:hypothetical protein
MAMEATAMVTWPDSVEQVFDGDLAIGLADITAKFGVILTPLTNFGLQDRRRGTITFLSSLGAWRKLARIRNNPKIALAFHTRSHGYADGTAYVLAQGIASFDTTPDREWLESIDHNWERFMGPRDRGLPWERWMRAYQWERVGVRIDVARVLTWSTLDCEGRPTVHGAARPATDPAEQSAPAKGSHARVDVDLVARSVTQLPHTLLGWVDSDGYPMVVPVRGTRVQTDRLILDVPYQGLPAGGRRAGLTSHWFSDRVLGQEQRVHTGWLEVDRASRRVSYAPHTRAGYRLPPSKHLYRVAVGGATRRGLRQARRVGFLAHGRD